MVLEIMSVSIIICKTKLAWLYGVEQLQWSPQHLGNLAIERHAQLLFSLSFLFLIFSECPAKLKWNKIVYYKGVLLS